MSLIMIQPLVVDGNEIIPAFRMGDDITNYGMSPLAVYKSAPTLAQHNHAFFGRNQDRSYVSPEYRNSVFSNRHKGEWTATFLRDGKEAIERPDNIFYRNGLLIAEGGKVAKIELPPEGWALEYDKPTGFPSRTGNRKGAEKVFGSDASYFWYNSSGLRAIKRVFIRFPDGSGPFLVDALWLPDDRHDVVGSRSVVQ